MEPQPKKTSTKSTTTRKRTSKPRVTVPEVPSSETVREYLAEPQATKSGVTTQPTPDLEAVIAVRAYELYEKRGREGGHDVDDWLEAEREILGRLGIKNDGMDNGRS